jgi:hypothetical protein
LIFCWFLEGEDASFNLVGEDKKYFTLSSSQVERYHLIILKLIRIHQLNQHISVIAIKLLILFQVIKNDGDSFLRFLGELLSIVEGLFLVADVISDDYPIIGGAI